MIVILNSIIIIFFSQLVLTLILLIIFVILKNIPFFALLYKAPSISYFQDNTFLMNNIPEDILVENIGLDSLIYLRMIRSIRNIFLFSSIITCGILLPLHIISDPQSLTWENYDKEDNHLWAHIICIWLIVVYINYILLQQNIEISKLRILYIEKHNKNPECHTIYISNIPKNIDIYTECKRIYGNNSIASFVKIRLHSAFVIFKKRVSHVIAITSLHHREKLTWITKTAPKSNQIIWSNIDIIIWFRILRSIIMWFLYVLIVVFYIVPITGIQGLQIILEKDSNSYLYNLSIDLTISILIHLIMLILPWVFGLLYRGMGVISTYDVDFGIVNMLFYFQIVTLFLESIITGSILENLKTLFVNPNRLLEILLNGLVSSSYFFINYICVAGLGGIGIRNLRILSLIKYIFKKVKSISLIDDVSELWYNKNIPLYMIIFLLGLTYSCINPIICPIVLVYACISIIPEKYNHTYIYNKKHESGGNLWVCIFNQIMVSVYIFELLMLFEFYSVYSKFVCLLPLPFLSLLYHYVSNRLFNPLLESIPLHEASLLDEKEPELTDEDAELIRISYDENHRD